MENIGGTVKNLMRALETQKKAYSKGDPERAAKKIFSKKELEHIKFNYIKDGVINLNVDSSVWLYSLSLQKADLLVKLRKKSPAVKNIRFHLGEVK